MKRLRRLRQNEAIRNLVKETRLSPQDFIYPIFVTEGKNIKSSIKSMPNIFQYSIDRLSEILDEVKSSKISGIMIFGIPNPQDKDELATQAYNENGITQKAIRFIKKHYPEIICIADVCLCEYTKNGHCGLVKDGEILNDETLPLLCKTATSLAQAGADIIAPSDMMDGRIEAIRTALDNSGFKNTPIMAYSAKFASAYYGPFRDAAQSAPCFGDRKSYQMDFSNPKEALREIETDIEEGADIVMIKPALIYLDILKEACQKFNHPIAVYNVSGEYSMVKAAAINGWIDERKIVTENLTAMKRAGANIIITYHALDMAKWLNE